MGNHMTNSIDGLRARIADWRLRRIAARRMRALFPQLGRGDACRLPANPAPRSVRGGGASPCWPPVGPFWRLRIRPIVAAAGPGLPAGGVRGGERGAAG